MADWRDYPLTRTPICCAMPAASPWPTREPTPGLFRIIWGTGIFSTPSGTRPPTRRDLNGCGGRESLARPRVSLMRFHVGAQNRVDACLIAALLPEPFQQVSIQAHGD